MGHILRVAIALCVIGVLATAQSQQPRGSLLDLALDRKNLAEKCPDLEECDIILLTLDSIQADRVGLLGGKNPEPMPNLDALAKNSTVFDNAYSPSPHRTTALAAIHHSLYPSTVFGVGDTANTDSIAAVLTDNGFNPFAVLRYRAVQSTKEPVGKISSIFDFDDRRCTNRTQLEGIVESMGKRTAGRRRGERFFGWMHLSYTYPPATYHPGHDLGFSREDHYRAALRFTDQAIGEILTAAEKQSPNQKRIVIVTGVTGMKEVPKSGKGLYQKELDRQTLRVPLLIHVPGLPAARITSPVETVDIAPTIMDLVGVQIPWSCQGRSLLGHLMEGSSYKDDRAVFASHIRFSDDPTQSTVQRIRQDDWTLHFGPSLKPSVLQKAGESGNVIGKYPEKAAELGVMLEEFQIMNEFCTFLWRRGEKRPADFSGPDGDIARARFYGNRLHPKGLKKAREIVKKGNRNLAEALEIMIRMGAQEKPDDLKAFFSHPAMRVRSLAAALLLGTSEGQTALDYVAAGLQDNLPVTSQEAILNAILQKKAKGADEVLASYKPEGANKVELAALRDLTLSELGNKDALTRLPQHLLEPNSRFDRVRIFEALKKMDPKRMTGLCKIILAHGSDDDRLTAAALTHLFEADARDSAFEVAQAIKPASSPEVVTQAISLLNFWQSHEGVASCFKLGKEDLENADLAARVLMVTPAIFDSPIIPSRRFDHFSAERMQGDMSSIKKAAEFAEHDLTFSVTTNNETYVHLAVLFEATPKEAVALRPEDIRVSIDANEKNDWLGRGKVSYANGLYCYVDRIPANWIEKGTNKFTLKARHASRIKIKANAVGFVLFPDTPSKDIPIVGIDTKPLSKTPGVRKAVGTIDNVNAKHVLWIRRDGTGKLGGELRVMANGKTFMRIATADLSTPRAYTVTLPERTNRDTKIELLCVDVPTDMSMTALLIEKRE